MIKQLLRKFSINDDGIDLSIADNFEQVFSIYFAPLCFYAQKYIDLKDAEDEVSSLFLRLWDKKSHFVDLDHLQAYLYTSTKNACLDAIKKQQRSSVRQLHFSKTIEEINHSFIKDIIQTESWAEIYREINSLPKQCSKTIKLSYLEGLSNQQIAEELNLSIQTVKNHKYRGMKVLRSKLSNANYLLLLSLFIN